MGFLDKLFGKKTTTKESVIKEEKEYQSDWDYYLTDINDHRSSIAVDLALNKIAPINDQPNLVWISVKLNNPTENGLSISEELPSLAAIEDALVAAIENKYVSTNIGRLTSNGCRVFYFYLGDNLLYDKAISDTMVAFPTYEYDYGTAEEQTWDCYFKLLYPDSETMQSITNRKVITSLMKNGDKLTREREVDHWIFFKNATDMDTYAEAIIKENFIIVNKDYDTAFGKLPHRLRIKRIDKVDQDSIDEYVIYLWRLANDCNGDYDGWETSVEKD